MQFRAILRRIETHNAAVQDNDHKLTPVYVVRFDSRGYRTFSADEAWGYYKAAHVVERVVLQAESPVGYQTNHTVGEHIEIKLDADAETSPPLL